MEDSEFHLYYLEASSGSATIQPSEGTEIGLGIVPQIANVSLLVGWVEIFHNPFEVEQTWQIADIWEQLRNPNFVQIHHQEFIYDGKASMPSFVPLQTMARLNNYFAVFFDSGETSSSKTSYLKRLPDEQYWNFLRNQSRVGHVEIHANLSLLSVTTDYGNVAWQNLSHRARNDLIRLIEVWHPSLSKLNTKTLLSKLERATNQQRQSLVGIFGAWNNNGLAKKKDDHWEFDVPKILANYKLLPLNSDAILEFKRRGQEFKARHDL
jgi:hypothetical protein